MRTRLHISVTHAQSPRIAFLRHHLQANLMLATFIQQPGPHHTEFNAALPEENDQGIQSFQFVTNRAQPRPRCREVERVRQFFKQGAGSVPSTHAHGQHSLNAILLTPVYFHFLSHGILLRNSVPQA